MFQPVIVLYQQSLLTIFPSMNSATIAVCLEGCPCGMCICLAATCERASSWRENYCTIATAPTGSVHNFSSSPSYGASRLRQFRALYGREFAIATRNPFDVAGRCERVDAIVLDRVMTYRRSYFKLRFVSEQNRYWGAPACSSRASLLAFILENTFDLQHAMHGLIFCCCFEPAA